MTRETDTAARLAILLVFLKNDNQALNVSRITAELEDQGISKFTMSSPDEAVPVKPTVATVSVACQDLCDQGLLEMMMVIPPRSPGKRQTPHYFLPISDAEKARKTTEHILEWFGPQLVNSAYGQIVSTAVVQGILERLLLEYDIKLIVKPNDSLAKIIADSPEAMRRAMKDDLITSLRRLSGGKTDRNSLVEALDTYLSAARTIDISDDNNRKETPGKADVISSV